MAACSQKTQSSKGLPWQLDLAPLQQLQLWVEWPCGAVNSTAGVQALWVVGSMWCRGTVVCAILHVIPMTMTGAGLQRILCTVRQLMALRHPVANFFVEAHRAQSLFLFVWKGEEGAG